MKLSWANRITILRILLIVPFVSCMLKINDPDLSRQLRDIMRYISTVIFLVMAVSDWLDGYLARRNGQVTRLGAFLDPTADKLLISSACLLLASKRAGVDGFLLPQTVVVMIIGKDLLLLIGFVIVYFITAQVCIAPVFTGKLSTALQLSMTAAILLAPEISAVVPGWIWVLRLLWWGAAAAAAAATLVYIHKGSVYIEKFETDVAVKKPIK